MLFGFAEVCDCAILECYLVLNLNVIVLLSHDIRHFHMTLDKLITFDVITGAFFSVELFVNYLLM